MAPTWLALLAPLPEDALVLRKPVASPELAATGKLDAIAGWDSISVNLSSVEFGHRHILITLDGGGALVSGGDNVLFHREEERGGTRWNVYDQQSIGGRFESDGSFRGTCWHTHTEYVGDDDEQAITSAQPSPPTAQQIEQLRAIVAWVIDRAPDKPA